MISEALDTYFPKLATMPELKQDIIAISKVITLEAGTVILKQGAYVKNNTAAYFWACKGF
ncbi:MAG: CRP/FNR family transcriptional regulator [Dokdonia sp.]